jgi:hypothetical protein
VWHGVSQSTEEQLAVSERRSAVPIYDQERGERVRAIGELEVVAIVDPKFRFHERAPPARFVSGRGIGHRKQIRINSFVCLISAAAGGAVSSLAGLSIRL